MFHVEHRYRFVGQFRQGIHTGQEDLGAVAVELIQYALPMAGIQFGCEIIQQNHRPLAARFMQVSRLGQQAGEGDQFRLAAGIGLPIRAGNEIHPPVGAVRAYPGVADGQVSLPVEE